jgi:hypothetical protein
MTTPSMIYLRRFPAGVWLALVASLVGAPAFSQESVVLRLDAPVGTTTRYRTETRSWPPGGSVDSTVPNCVVTDVATESIIALDGDIGTVSTVIESRVTDLSGTGMGPQLSKVTSGRGRTTVRRIDRRGRTLSTEVTKPGKGVGKGEEVAEHAGGAFTLPDGPVSVGDTWTAPDTIPGGWGTGGRIAVVQITYRLERIELAGTGHVAVVSMNGMFISWRISGSSAPSGTTAAAVPGTMTGELRIDLDARRVVSLVTMLERNWGTDRGFRTRMTKTVVLASAAGN